MSDCPTCGLPMVWSTDRERTWCAVYGDHLVHLHGKHPAIGLILQHETGRSHPLMLIEGAAS